MYPVPVPVPSTGSGTATANAPATDGIVCDLAVAVEWDVEVDAVQMQMQDISYPSSSSPLSHISFPHRMRTRLSLRSTSLMLSLDERDCAHRCQSTAQNSVSTSDILSPWLLSVNLMRWSESEKEPRCAGRCSGLTRRRGQTGQGSHGNQLIAVQYNNQQRLITNDRKA